MKIDPERHNIEQPYPPEVEKALFVVGDFLNNFRAGDLTANFTIHRDGESITYELTIKEIKRHLTYIDADIKEAT